VIKWVEIRKLPSYNWAEGLRNRLISTSTMISRKRQREDKGLMSTVLKALIWFITNR